ncbi:MULTISPECIES: hypothetical protein [Flavobacteriaceae]|uniref:hypothetical protein n=1 Tax=Flavobacteriaceae TaxID=49546 RepID=UPI001491D549|nr:MULTISPECIES: hypothetical protein [Allomuricauda]MDC6366614.1 hypothetical protein [Muricauda sp. AC10]
MKRLSSKFFRLQIEKFESAQENIAADQIFNCIKSIESGANKISSWSLSVVGGSILTLLSESYIHPDNGLLKLPYLLFFFGWIFLAFSLYNAKEILGRSIAADLFKGRKDLLMPIFRKCNNQYKRQLMFFNLALLTFGIWLVVYLIWWIFLNGC